MKSEQVDFLKRKTVMIKNLPKLLKIFLAIFIGAIFLVLMFKVGDFVYCHTLASCHPIRTTRSPEDVATQVVSQYEMAIQDINARRYDIAKQRLEYVLSFAPEYSGAKEKLLEVDKLLQLTPTP